LGPVITKSLSTSDRPAFDNAIPKPKRASEENEERVSNKAYDADRIRELIHNQGATPNIPPKRNRRWKPCFSKRLYRDRNLIERFFSKLKHFRRVTTRYDKLAANFLAMVQLASMRLWLRVYESTA
jgi:transposase